MEKRYKDLRDEHLREAYKNLLHDCSVNTRFIKADAIVSALMECTAPRFYITPKSAMRIVNAYYRGEITYSTTYRMDMIEDLVENYERIVSRRKRMQKAHIWEELVECKARSFYIGKKSISNIIFNYTSHGKSKTRTETRSE